MGKPPRTPSLALRVSVGFFTLAQHQEGDLRSAGWPGPMTGRSAVVGVELALELLYWLK